MNFHVLLQGIFPTQGSNPHLLLWQAGSLPLQPAGKQNVHCSIIYNSQDIEEPYYCCSVAKPCPTLCNPMDCSPPGSCVHGILQVRILEWAAISFFRGSSRPRDQTHISHISFTGRQVFTTCTTWEAPYSCRVIPQSYSWSYIFITVNSSTCFCVLDRFIAVGHLAMSRDICSCHC